MGAPLPMSKKHPSAGRCPQLEVLSQQVRTSLRSVRLSASPSMWHLCVLCSCPGANGDLRIFSLAIHAFQVMVEFSFFKEIKTHLGKQWIIFLK